MLFRIKNRSHLLRQGTRVQSLGQEDPACRGHYVRVPQLQTPASPRNCAPDEKPPQGETCAPQLESRPCSLQAGEARTQAEINQNIDFKDKPQTRRKTFAKPAPGKEFVSRIDFFFNLSKLNNKQIIQLFLTCKDLKDIWPKKTHRRRRARARER